MILLMKKSINMKKKNIFLLRFDFDFVYYFKLGYRTINNNDIKSYLLLFLRIYKDNNTSVIHPSPTVLFPSSLYW